MEKLSLCFLIIISLSSAFAQKDMSKKAFVFPKESNSSFVTLTAQLRRPFTAFTVCLRVYTDLSHEISTICDGGTFSPNVLDWRALNYTVHGEVFTKPQLWS
ncbi:C-reactive protein-like isoform X2 [Diceros bicornis minor]|uniref:C-reactive protein-like isoform X2 n=1 Tax=Diceros bicornis minor TaxID=77932 RepID=UPI0026F0ADFB|nr:C-reactive protein-like isoform X2 [Diceros bicornis minor]